MNIITNLATSSSKMDCFCTAK